MYNKLKGRIIAAGLTQRTVAEKIGICEHTLSKKLSGKTEFKLSEILLIADLLGIEKPVADEFLP